MNYNHVLLIGNVVADPELRYLPSGSPVCNLRLATNHTYTSNGEKKTDPCYIDVALFGASGERMGQLVAKGQNILIEGRLSQRTWETPEGQKRSKHEIIASRWLFVEKKQDHEGAGEY